MRADLEYGTVARMVRASAERFPTTEALVEGDRRWTFPELVADIDRAANAFIATGIETGDRVAIWAPNVSEWVIAAFGALSAGAVVVPINTRFKGPEAAYVLAKSGARALLCVNGFLDFDYVGALQAARTDAGGLPHLETVIVFRGDTPTGTVAWEQFLARSTSVVKGALHDRLLARTPTDVADIIFTSGTTGRPKGVMCSNAQNLRVFEVWSGVFGLSHGDRYLIVNPFFHTFGYKAGLLSCFLRGATMIPEAVFDVDSALARIAAERVNTLPGPPTLFLSILNHPDRSRYDLSSLRKAMTGAAAIPVEMIERMRAELTFDTVLTAYGLTESTGVVSTCWPDDDAETIAQTSGRAIPDTEVRIVDDGNVEVARGTAGEIVCRGYNVMLGYFEDPVATAEAVDGDGWLHTGDVGVMDGRGYIQITDRKKDMYVYGGFNAYPAEIENTIMSHDAVGQVAVVGVPDERMGEVGMAFVVPRPGSTVDPQGMIAWCRERMANYKVPRYVRIVTVLPLNASGKVLKYELREIARNNMSSS